jgi:hypothetical protein
MFTLDLQWQPRGNGKSYREGTQSVPHEIALALLKDKLPRYESDDAAIDVISLLYVQCVIWVGSTVSPSMALCGMCSHGIMFFAQKVSKEQRPSL